MISESTKLTVIMESYYQFLLLNCVFLYSLASSSLSPFERRIAILIQCIKDTKHSKPNLSIYSHDFFLFLQENCQYNAPHVEHHVFYELLIQQIIGEESSTHALHRSATSLCMYSNTLTFN